MADAPTNTFDVDLDVRGYNCPLPILRTKTTLVRMAPGERLRVRATDPHSVVDFLAFCDKTGHTLVERHESGGEYHFLLERAAEP